MSEYDTTEDEFEQKSENIPERRHMNIISKLKTITSLLTVIVALAQLGLAQKEIPMLTEKGSIVLLFSGFSYEVGGIGHLQAAIRNDTSFTLQTVSFEMVGYDANGHEVKLCRSGRCSFGTLDPLNPGQARRIT